MTNVLEIGEKSNKEKAKSEQLMLEAAIICYQEAIQKNDKQQIDKRYEQICKLYPVMNYIHVWMKRYLYLYDSSEDFAQDYLRIFCTSLVNWKPKHLRKESRYNGSGDFKNYFWSSLQNNYINMVKAENSGKRSIASKCPLCDEWCASLSTHLIQQHDEFLWDLMIKSGFIFDDLDKCPFCQSWKISTKLASTIDKAAIKEKLKRHILSMHSNYLFEHFKEEYPGYITGQSSKPSSIYVSSGCEDDNELNMYDTIGRSGSVEDLYNSGLTETQEQIVFKILNDRGRNLCVVYDPNLYNCKEEEFQLELDDLKQKLFLCGIDTERK